MFNTAPGAVMEKLTPSQRAALELFRLEEPRTAYRTAPLRTMRALERKGYTEDVTPRGAGGMFSPTTHYRWALTHEGRVFLSENRLSQNDRAL